MTETQAPYTAVQPDTDGVAYDDGNWYAVTLGFFIGLLVDAGQDPAVMFRVVDDSPPDEKGTFVRTLNVIMLPDGYVAEAAKRCKGVHKVLKALLEKGVVR